jgi:hypothetical protein
VISVVLSHPNGQREDVLLAGVPRLGDYVRLRNGPSGPALRVDHVEWLQATSGETEPTVIVVVVPHENGRP